MKIITYWLTAENSKKLGTEQIPAQLKACSKAFITGTIFVCSWGVITLEGQSDNSVFPKGSVTIFADTLSGHNFGLALQGQLEEHKTDVPLVYKLSI